MISPGLSGVSRQSAAVIVSRAAIYSQMAVTAHFSSTQILLLAFHCGAVTLYTRVALLLSYHRKITTPLSPDPIELHTHTVTTANTRFRIRSAPTWPGSDLLLDTGHLYTYSAFRSTLAHTDHNPYCCGDAGISHGSVNTTIK